MSQTERIWHKGSPPHIGWWNASFLKEPRIWRWWNGKAWSVSSLAWQLQAPVRTEAELEMLQGRIEWTDYYPDNARVPRVDPRHPLTNLSLTSPSMELTCYDAVEVYGCTVDGDGNIERVDSSEQPVKFWSVALHLVAGGIETIADFDKETQADAFGDLMTTVLREFRSARGMSVRHLGRVSLLEVR